MARKENYFHPVKDLITTEEKKNLVGVFDSIRSDTNNFVWLVKQSPHQTSKLASGDYTMKNQNEVDDHENLDFTKGFIDSRSFSKLFGSSNANMKICEEMCERYGANYWTFLYFEDQSDAFGRHRDGKHGRKCAMTFPLYPDYAEYRNTNFYDSMQQEEPSATLSYSQVMSPMLINVGKYHEIVKTEINKPSLCFQLMFGDKSYLEVRKMLQQNFLLSTPV
jgi:hypothetical protein